MKAASPEDPAVSHVLAQAGAGNQCLIMEVTPGGESHHVACPAPALFQPGCVVSSAGCLDNSKQKDCCLYHRQRHRLMETSGLMGACHRMPSRCCIRAILVSSGFW